MEKSLLRYTPSERQLRQQRVATERSKADILAEIQIASIKADGAIALGEHIMRGVRALDDHRRDLACGDPVTNQVLADIELNAIEAVKRIQSNIFNEWGIKS